ncbi:MAG: hypothetical protein LBI44_05300 [Oscillospiraceae bacterium]|jgi:hypothetical protein|nr:hypothetical protein [Oscillospiraceae bacterium]
MTPESRVAGLKLSRRIERRWPNKKPLAATVLEGGRVDMDGTSVDIVCGIRPALWLEL